jgi:hypothetical protein
VIVAAILSTVPISADRTGDEDCTGGDDGFPLLGFCFFVAIGKPLLGQVEGPDPDAPRRIFSDRWTYDRTPRQRSA